MVVILRIASSRMWGKGHLYVFMVTFDALCPLFTNDADYFRFCIILGA